LQNYCGLLSNIDLHASLSASALLNPSLISLAFPHGQYQATEDFSNDNNTFTLCHGFIRLCENF
jgi:hypothetical protein